MVEFGIVAELIEGADGAGFGVGASIDQVGDSGVYYCAGAHGAGFESYYQGAI